MPTGYPAFDHIPTGSNCAACGLAPSIFLIFSGEKPPACGLRASLAGWTPSGRRVKARAATAQRLGLDAPGTTQAYASGGSRRAKPARLPPEPHGGECGGSKGAAPPWARPKAAQSINKPRRGHFLPEGEPRRRRGGTPQGCPSLGTKELDIGRNAKDLKINNLKKGGTQQLIAAPPAIAHCVG